MEIKIEVTFDDLDEALGKLELFLTQQYMEKDQTAKVIIKDFTGDFERWSKK